MREGVFYTACKTGNFELVQALLQYQNIDINHLVLPDPGGVRRTALSVACAEGHLEIVKLLMNDPRIEVNKQDKSGEMPLHRACWNGHIDVVKFLMNDPRIEVNKEDESGWTPFFHACIKGYQGNKYTDEVVKLLMQYKSVDINKQGNMNGETVFFHACKYTNPGLIELLLKNGANPFIPSNDGLRSFDYLPKTLGVNTINAIQHRMQVYGYMYGHINENNNPLNLTKEEFIALRNEANTLLTSNPEVMNIFASNIFNETAPKNSLLDALTEKNMDVLVNKLKSLFENSGLSAINSADKISALKDYNFSEPQIKKIESGLESNNEAVLDGLTSLLNYFETDIEGVEGNAIYSGSLLNLMEDNSADVDFVKSDKTLALYKDVIDDIKSLLDNNEKNDATIKLINHLLPEVKHLMVTYISNMIQRVASDADSFQGQEKETVSKYFPQSLRDKSLSDIQKDINDKFNDIFVEFSKKTDNPTTHGFAIYVIEALNGIDHNNDQYSIIDAILSKHDKQIKADMTENKDVAEKVASIIEKAIEKEGSDHKLKDIVHKEFITSDDHDLLVADMQVLLLNYNKLSSQNDYINFINDAILCTPDHDQAIDSLLGQAYHEAIGES